MNASENELIRQYYELLGQEVIQPANVWQAMTSFSKKKTGILVSDQKLLRGFGVLYHMPEITYATAKSAAEDHFAFADALRVLAAKGTPVYFYNRVGKMKNAYAYAPSALERMEKGLNFPKMAADAETYQDHLKELLGDDFTPEYLEDLQKIPQIVRKGNIYSHEDSRGRLVNVVNGKRVTVFAPEHATKRLHLYGRCGAFGYAVSDEETLASQIQKEIADQGIQVINHGLWGGEDKYILHNFFNEVAGFDANDIVVFYMMHFDKKILPIYEELGMHYLEITEDWHRFPEAAWCFYDKPGHMNAAGYRNAAGLITVDMKANAFSAKEVKTENAAPLDAKYLNAYLKSHKDGSFEKEVEDYVHSLMEEMPPLENGQTAGSIVMNCNPFTNGHRYLIEYAAKQVDRLYIFVVQEDRSYFRFEDRFEMVKKGTADLENVLVVPSGNFIISTLTFPEYFLKDYVKEKNFDVSQDLETFCSLIAKPLGIKVRFAGEEPFDPVTENYNENMRKILPAYGMEFVEIPRLKVEGTSEQVNATRVRQLIAEKNTEELKKYIPQTTMDVIVEKYLG